jgi:SAM-dependent methyltransferase
MHPEDTATRYNRIARWWQTQHQGSLYGVAQLERAIKFTTKKKLAIDIGCGSSGRFITVLSEHGFQVEGLDISEEMINLAKQLHPDITFYRVDICCWNPSQSYDLIVAWDSTFHLPLDMQEPVMKKLCDALEPDGVLMFTCGGGYRQDEVSGTFQDQDFEYSTLGVNDFLKILTEQHCTCLHLEYDQYPENHVYIIAQKTCSTLGMNA